MLFYLPAVGGGDEVCVFVCMLWVWGVRGCVGSGTSVN